MNRLIVVAVVAAVGFGGGWAVNGWRLSSTHNAEKAEAAMAAKRQLDAMVSDRDRLAGALAQSNDLHLNLWEKDRGETNKLRDCLRRGTCGLRVAATCPDPNRPPGTPGAGVGAGTGARLAADAEPDYFALRDGITRTQRKLAACQAELKLRTAQP